MPASRSRGAFRLSLIIVIIVAGAVLFSALFYTYWQRLNRQVETILQDQFNQQQLMLARKIADNVESYFDFLENALLGYAGLFQTTPPDEGTIDAALEERFARHNRFGLLQITRYNPEGVGVQSFSTSPKPPPAGSLTLPADFLKWAQAPEHRGRLFLGQTFDYPGPSWKGRRVMRFVTPLYWGKTPKLAGVLEFLIDPLFICEKVTAGVRSGQTGYAWIIDQNLIMLAHYEKDFVGHEAMKIRISRNPQIVFRGLNELHDRLLAGQE
ncbi:MAG TPA: cache domain-containing protein, partial [Desulfobaccales bacterium]|nr:cache domain-containing protein [Desulfobaccales bacterium]